MGLGFGRLFLLFTVLGTDPGIRAIFDRLGKATSGHFSSLSGSVSKAVLFFVSFIRRAHEDQLPTTLGVPILTRCPVEPVKRLYLLAGRRIFNHRNPPTAPTVELGHRAGRRVRGADSRSRDSMPLVSGVSALSAGLPPDPGLADP